MANEQVRLIDLIDDMSSGKDVFFRTVRFVKDVMTEKVKTLALNNTIAKCLEFMEQNQIRHVPIVDCPTGHEEKPCLVGIVSDRDIFRQISPYLGKIGETDSDSRMARQPLMQIISRKPEIVTPATSVASAIKLMIDNNIEMLPVMSNHDLVGIITTTDILMVFIRLDAILRLNSNEGKKKQRRNIIDALSKNSDESTFQVSSVLQTVEDVMTEQVVCLDEEETVAEAMKIMQAENFMHLPVVGKTEKLVGVIFERDILRHLQYNRRQIQSQTDDSCTDLFNVAPNDPILKQTVRHIMKPNVAHVQLDHDFYGAVKMLYEMKSSCLPVVDDERKVLGLFTVADVMRGLLAVYALSEKSIA